MASPGFGVYRVFLRQLCIMQGNAEKRFTLGSLWHILLWHDETNTPWEETWQLHGHFEPQWIPATRPLSSWQWCHQRLAVLKLKVTKLNCLVYHIPKYSPLLALLSLAIVLILKGKMDQLMVWFGIKCSSWIGVNVGTSGRSPCNPFGRYWYKSVGDANTMLERTIFLLDLNLSTLLKNMYYRFS